MKILSINSRQFSFLRISVLFFLVFFTAQTFAQEASSDLKYRRSSLYTLMISDEAREFSSVIQESFTSSPIPEKFNDHIITHRNIPKNYDSNLPKEDLSTAKEASISEYFTTNDIAKLMVAKWFNRSENGGFNMDLIAERGSYNATEMDVELAKSSKRGMALLADAGEELIRNTFVWSTILITLVKKK